MRCATRHITRLLLLCLTLFLPFAAVAEATSADGGAALVEDSGTSAGAAGEGDGAHDSSAGADDDEIVTLPPLGAPSPSVWGALIYIFLGGFVVYALVHLLNRFTERVRKGHGPMRHIALRIAPVFKVFMAIAYIAFIIQVAVNTHTLALWIVGALVIVVFSLGGVELMRNIISGLSIALQRPFAVGDHVHIDGHEGEVRHIGLLSTVLVRPDGVLVELPNRQFLTHAVINYTPDQGLFPVEIRLAVPTGLPPERARVLAMNAACVSRFSSPYRRPTVTIEASEDSERLHLLLRTHAFSPETEPHLCTDIIEIFRAGSAKHRKPIIRLEPRT